MYIYVVERVHIYKNFLFYVLCIIVPIFVSLLYMRLYEKVILVFMYMNYYINQSLIIVDICFVFVYHCLATIVFVTVVSDHTV